MRVLHILSYSPIPMKSGGALRTYHIAKMVAKNHQSTIVTYGVPKDKIQLHNHFGVPLENIHIVPHPMGRRYIRFMQGVSLFTGYSHFHYALNGKHMEDTVKSLLDTQDFDVVLTEFPIIGASRVKTNALKILDAHNIEYEIYERMSKTSKTALRRWYYNLEYRKIYREEMDILGRQDALFVMSDRDASVFDAHLPHIPKFVIPNGVDMGYFEPEEDVKPEPYSLVFTGTMRYLPNSSGMLYFLDEIFPRIKQTIPQAKVYIVGMDPPADLWNRRSDDVIVTGGVDDVRPYVHKASAYVVPLQAGSGTRLKVLEALAMKKPIVTTSLGCEGINVVHGESALIADTPQMFADSVIELLQNEALKQQLIGNGYELARARYDWPVIGEQMEAAYKNLIPSNKVPEVEEETIIERV